MFVIQFIFQVTSLIKYVACHNIVIWHSDFLHKLNNYSQLLPIWQSFAYLSHKAYDAVSFEHAIQKAFASITFIFYLILQLNECSRSQCYCVVCCSSAARLRFKRIYQCVQYSWGFRIVSHIKRKLECCFMIMAVSNTALDTKI